MSNNNQNLTPKEAAKETIKVIHEAIPLSNSIQDLVAATRPSPMVLSAAIDLISIWAKEQCDDWDAVRQFTSGIVGHLDSTGAFARDSDGVDSPDESPGDSQVVDELRETANPQGEANG